MDRTSMQPYSPTMLRIALGLLFLVPGIGKLLNNPGTTSFFESLGIPAPMIMAWVVGVVEVVGGILLLIGWKTEWAVWPLAVILLVATVTVHLQNFATNPVGVISHVLGIIALVSVWATGPGKWAVGAQA